MKSMLKLSIVSLLSFILIFNVSISASSLSTSQQQEIITYLSQLDVIQKRVSTLSQDILFPPNDMASSFNYTLSQLHDTLDKISQEILSTSASIPNNQLIYRDLLILLNASNYIKASLYELEALTSQTTPPEKLSTLERYFNFRIYANNSIRFFSNLQLLN